MKIGIWEASKRLGVSVYKLRRLVLDKHVPAEIVDTAKFVFDTDELDKIEIGSLPDYRGIVEVNEHE